MTWICLFDTSAAPGEARLLYERLLGWAAWREGGTEDSAPGDGTDLEALDCSAYLESLGEGDIRWGGNLEPHLVRGASETWLA